MKGQCYDIYVTDYILASHLEVVFVVSELLHVRHEPSISRLQKFNMLKRNRYIN